MTPDTPDGQSMEETGRVVEEQLPKEVEADPSPAQSTVASESEKETKTEATPTPEAVPEAAPASPTSESQPKA